MKNAVLGGVAVSMFWLPCGFVSGRHSQKPEPGVTGAGLSKEDTLNRLRVVNDLKLLVLCLQSLHDADQAFPPADGAEIEQKGILAPPKAGLKLPPGFSWRAQVLHLCQSNTTSRDIFFGLCQNKYPLAKGAVEADNWNRPDLKKTPFQALLRESPEQTKDTTWDTKYRVFIGKGAAFEQGKRLTEKDFTDGLDKTILIVEAGEAVPWPKPEELAYDPAKPLPKLGGTFPDGFYAAFADGSVRFIKNGTDEKLLRAMITRNGGEKITELPPKVDSNALRKAAGLKD
jgi:hypothetical protein